MNKVIIFFVGFYSLVQICQAQDTITTTDEKVIKAKSEIIVGRYFSNLLNTISYAGAESNEIKELINESFIPGDKQIFLNKDITISDDVSDANYTNSFVAPEIPASQYLNAFNTFYGKSDSNSVFIKDVRSSEVRKGKKNIYINVYFTSFFKNVCLPYPDIPYRPANRVAEIFIKRSNNNKWLLYISRIGFLTPADTVNDDINNVAVIETKNISESMGIMDETLEPADKLNLYIMQARLEESKRNYTAAVNDYTRAIELAPEKGAQYQDRIKELNKQSGIMADLERKYKAGDYQNAVKAYTKLLEDPTVNTNYTNSDYYLGRAKCFDKMGELTRSYNQQVEFYNNALSDYAKSYQYDRENMETIRCRAALYKRMNKPAEAPATQ